jgi:hypothetical protein
MRRGRLSVSSVSFLQTAYRHHFYCCMKGVYNLYSHIAMSKNKQLTDRLLYTLSISLSIDDMD